MNSGTRPPLQLQRLRILRTNETNVCKKCNKEFELGDILYHKLSGRITRKVAHYHNKCWESMFIE